MKVLLMMIATTLMSGHLAYGASNFQKMACKISRNSKVFNITPTKISVNNQSSGRSVASNKAIRTIHHELGFTKHFNLGDGHQYILHVSNTEEPSEMNDYLIMRSQRGHEIIYPISCQK